MVGEIAAAEVRETHISWVFLTADRAYKLLKPITTNFLDFGSSDLRCAAAQREVELNRRVAPDVYLGLGDLVENGELVDQLIIMRRMPEERRLSRMVDDPSFDHHVREIARTVAALHAGEPAVTGDRAQAIAGRDAVAGNWEANFADLAAVADELIDSVDYAEAAARARRFLAAQSDLFTRRIDEGFVRDGHGDLLAGDIFCLDDGPRILDCLAFDERLRIGDVLSDIGFLAMDLHRLAGANVARSLLKWYGEFSNEHHPASLAHHYMGYRAHVRAKIAALRWQQGSTSAADDLRVHHDLALFHLRRGEVRLVMVGGVPGTGKSTVASAIGAELGAVVLSSDELRKDLAHLGPDEHARSPVDSGLYAPERRAEVYEEMLVEAGLLLARGESVVMDASWSGADQRRLAESLGRERGVEVVAIECVVDATTARQRIAHRMSTPGVPSDATPDVADHMRATWPAWPEASQIDTAGTIEETLESALHAITG